MEDVLLLLAGSVKDCYGQILPRESRDLVVSEREGCGVAFLELLGMGFHLCHAKWVVIEDLLVMLGEDHDTCTGRSILLLCANILNAAPESGRMTESPSCAVPASPSSNLQWWDAEVQVLLSM